MPLDMSKLGAEKPTNPYAEHLQSTPGTAQTTLIKSHKGIELPATEKTTDETVHKGVVTSKATGMMLEVGVGRTINLQNYNSAKLDIRLRMPCEMDTMDATFDWMNDWLGKKLEDTINEAMGETGN